jgi:uncharacterized protein YegP (UPF0339 family)
MAAKFELKKAKNGKFMWNLKVGSGEPILTGQMYASKSGAKNGIKSVKKNARKDANFDRRKARSGKPYFVLRSAGNHHVIGRSETYSANRAMENGIKSVKKNAPGAPIDDIC